MSHKPNYTKYSNFSKPQEAPVVEPEVKDEEETVIEAVTEEPVVEPVIEEDGDETIGIIVKCERLNVRETASPDATVLTTVPKGAQVKVNIFESTSDFYKVCTEAGVEGYCAKDYISID